MDYTHYSVNDFVSDERFWKWVLDPDEETTVFWENWLQENPHQASVVARAREIILHRDARQYTLSDEKVKHIWQNIQKARQQDTSRQRPIRSRPIGGVLFRIPRYWIVAASLVGVLFIAIWLVRSLSETVYVTAYGETQTVTLPDRSMVTLNANSTLRVAARWAEENDRHVYLEGEAFFNVRHNNTKFTVHTDDLTVEVLGTQFNVNHRRSKTQVVLSRGQVKLNLRTEDLLMQPGDLAEFSRSSGQLVRKKVDPEVITSWRNKLLIFDGTPLLEVAQILEDNYGLQVVIKTKSLAERKITAEIATTELDTFLNALPELLSIKVTRNENKLMLEE